MNRTQNWTHPRSALVKSATQSVIRGWGSIGEIAENTLRRHYIGKSPERALKRLVQDIYQAVLHSNPSTEFKQMEARLLAEGWRFLPVNDAGSEGVFIHEPTGNMVNRNGGVFETYEDAVKATYNSATRAYLQGDGL